MLNADVTCTVCGALECYCTGMFLAESASNMPVKQKTGVAARVGTGRPRGRPKKVVVSQSPQASLSQEERQLSGLLVLFVSQSHVCYIVCLFLFNL